MVPATWFGATSPIVDGRHLLAQYRNQDVFDLRLPTRGVQGHDGYGRSSGCLLQVLTSDPSFPFSLIGGTDILERLKCCSMSSARSVRSAGCRCGMLSVRPSFEGIS